MEMSTPFLDIYEHSALPKLNLSVGDTGECRQVRILPKDDSLDIKRRRKQYGIPKGVELQGFFYPGSHFNSERLYHEFGHVVDFIIRGKEDKVLKADFGMYQESYDKGNAKEQEKRLAIVAKYEFRASYAERLLLNASDAAERKTHFDSGFLSLCVDFAKMPCEYAKGSKCSTDLYWQDAANFFPDITPASVLAAFERFVYIYNKAYPKDKPQFLRRWPTEPNTPILKRWYGS